MNLLSHVVAIATKPEHETGIQIFLYLFVKGKN